MLNTQNMRKDIALQTPRTLLLLAAVAISLSTSMQANSHETIPAQWCADEGTLPKIIKTFNFDKEALINMIEKCGVVDNDDQWHAATSAAQYYCETQLPKNRSQQLSIVPIITGPEAYNDKAHHSLYTVDEGLVGGCVVCLSTE